MKTLKTTLLAAGALSLLAGLAYAHPEAETETKDKKIIIKKLDKDLKINGDIELDGLDLKVLDLKGIDLEALIGGEFDVDSILEQMDDLKALSNLDVETSKLADGSTKIIIKRDGKTSLFSDGKKKNVWIKKHKMDDGHDEDVKVIVRQAEAKSGQYPHLIELDDGMEVEIEKDGEVTVTKNGKPMTDADMRDHSLSVEKSINTDNGKKKIRVVIEMETDE